MLTPVIVGVGDVVNRSLRVEHAYEPMQLILNAIDEAIRDSGAISTTSLAAMIDSIDVVACWTWPYDDLPGLLAERLSVEPSHMFMPSTHGGNQPAKLLDYAARRISLGQTNLAVVCGGEALASLGSCAKAKSLPPPGWTRSSRKVDSVFTPKAEDLATGLAAPHMIGAPIQIYPLYENAVRAQHKQSIADNNRESAEMYAAFAKIAEKQPVAWNFGKAAESAESIMTVTPKNRMICYPYPLLMNAFNNVNLAAACILTSTETARELGVPENNWIYPLGGAGTRDSYDFWERPSYHASPSISRSLDACLQASDLMKEDIDIFDFYSCFPIVPKIACHHLGLPTTNWTKPITLLGGLTSFGGAGNNYSMHALTQMVRELRSGKANNGLVLANGGMMTYQHAVCLSTRPRTKGAYPSMDPLPEVIQDVLVPTIDPNPAGPAKIETYTVDFDRDNKPIRGHIIGRLQNSGQRFIANHADAATLDLLSNGKEEPIGKHGIVKADSKKKGRNLFSFRGPARI